MSYVIRYSDGSTQRARKRALQAAARAARAARRDLVPSLAPRNLINEFDGMAPIPSYVSSHSSHPPSVLRGGMPPLEPEPDLYIPELDHADLVGLSQPALTRDLGYSPPPPPPGGGGIGVNDFPYRPSPDHPLWRVYAGVKTVAKVADLALSAKEVYGNVVHPFKDEKQDYKTTAGIVKSTYDKRLENEISQDRAESILDSADRSMIGKAAVRIAGRAPGLAIRYGTGLGHNPISIFNDAMKIVPNAYTLVRSGGRYIGRKLRGGRDSRLPSGRKVLDRAASKFHTSSRYGVIAPIPVGVVHEPVQRPCLGPNCVKR